MSDIVIEFVAFRYKLLWAEARTRNGKAALLILAALLLTAILMIVLMGGYAAAIVAAQAGRLGAIAPAVLGGVFLAATMMAVVSGLGVHDVFSDAVLRRYPLDGKGRLVVRHISGILD